MNSPPGGASPLLATHDGLGLILLLGGLVWIVLRAASAPRVRPARPHFIAAACWLAGITALLAIAVESASPVRTNFADALVVGAIAFAASVCVWYVVAVAVAWSWCYVVMAPVRRLAWIAAAARARRAAGEERRAARRQAQRRRDADCSAQEAQVRGLEEQRRRSDARFAVELVYDQRPELHDGFPRQRLNEHLATYLSDTYPPDLVEERARQLIQMMQDLAAGAGRTGAAHLDSLADIAARFQARRAELDSLSYDEETRNSLLTLLAHEEDAAIQVFLRR